MKCVTVRFGLAASLGLLVHAACGSGGSPTAPSTNPTTGSVQECRRYATQGTWEQTSVSGGQIVAHVAASFSAAFDSQAASLQYTQTTAGCSTSQTTKFRSVSDFIDEGKVLGLYLRDSDSHSVSGGCSGQASSGGTSTYTYDGLRRLISVRGSSDARTYSTWDTSGRPTAGTQISTGTACSSYSLTLSYNDAGRSYKEAMRCLTGSMAGDSLTVTFTVDADGNQVKAVSELVTKYGTGATNTTISVTPSGSSQVCKSQ